MDTTKTLTCALVSILLFSSACSSGSGTSAARPVETSAATQSLEVVEASSTTQSVKEVKASSTTQSVKEVELVVSDETEAQIAELAARITDLETEIVELKELADLRGEVTALIKGASTVNNELVGLKASSRALVQGASTVNNELVELKASSRALRNDVSVLEEVDWSPTEETVFPIFKSLVQQSPDLLRGPKGDQGDSGSQGPKGDHGDSGSRGPRGWTGATGPQGTRGWTGATGPQGTASSAAVTSTKLKNCISDLVSAISSAIRRADTSYSYGSSSPYITGHDHDTTGWFSISNPYACGGW